MEKKLRILCLHGYRQNAEVFLIKSGGFRKLIKSVADCHLITAPNVIDDNEGERGWWFSNISSFNAFEYCDDSIGFDLSIECIADAIKQQGPFDGILGFSQGATMAYMLCSMFENGSVSLQLKFGIFVSGFPSQCVQHKKYFTNALRIPTLHIMGETDQVIPIDASKQLLACCDKTTCIIHPGGHFLPSSSKYKEEILQFLKSFTA